MILWCIMTIEFIRPVFLIAALKRSLNANNSYFTYHGLVWFVSCQVTQSADTEQNCIIWGHVPVHLVNLIKFNIDTESIPVSTLWKPFKGIKLILIHTHTNAMYYKCLRSMHEMKSHIRSLVIYGWPLFLSRLRMGWASWEHSFHFMFIIFSCHLKTDEAFHEGTWCPVNTRLNASSLFQLWPLFSHLVNNHSFLKLVMKIKRSAPYSVVLSVPSFSLINSKTKQKANQVITETHIYKTTI